MAMNRAIQVVILLILLVSSSSAGETTMFYSPPSSLWHDSPDMAVPDFDIQKIMGYDQECRNDPTVNLYLFAQQMAKFKMNRLIINSPIFFFLKYETTTDDNDPDVPAEKRHWSYADYFAEFFEYCRSLHIEPIPSLDYQPALLRHNGNCLEYMIFDSDYIEQNNIRPGEGDYQGMPDYYQNYEDYPYPMPQPSWEFEIESLQENPGQIYYFADDKVKVYVGDGIYTYKPTGCYRVCGNDLYEIRVEKRNALNEWELLDEGTNYELNNVGLNKDIDGDGIGDASYYLLSLGGFYGVGDEEKANIEFTTVFSEGTEIRVSYTAPINLSLIWPDWGGGRQEGQLAYWICLSNFNQDLPADPIDDDTPENWVNWDTRDIWYVGLYEMINWLKPRYIDIQHCEMWVMHTDYRCREERKTPAYSNGEIYPGDMHTWEHNGWTYGHEIEYLRKTIADLDGDLGGNAQMMLYADMLDSHNGHYAEGRCWWDWYEESSIDEYHQPDADDPNWVGNVKSHIYYQPAMGGMGGWTWDERDEPNGLNPCNYGMMASNYITEKDTIVCREWGYQAGYFDDRDPEHIITWQDKFEERFRDLALQGFISFEGDCAGYALPLEGWSWGGIRLRFENPVMGDVYLHLSKKGDQHQLDGSNLNWVEMEGSMEDIEEDSVDLDMFLDVFNKDASFPNHTVHFVEASGKGCHIGAVQDGIIYIDDIAVNKNNVPLDIYNLDFEYDFPTDGSGVNWYPSVCDYSDWKRSDDTKEQGSYCCKHSMRLNDYVYDPIAPLTTRNERHYVGIGPEPNPYNLYFSGYVKTIKFDALRHLNPKIWMDLSYSYQPQDSILGVVNTIWVEDRNYSGEPTSADWMWSKKYPVSPFVKYLFYDPYYLFMGDRMIDPSVVIPPNAPYPKDLEEISP